jgi:PilZ domain
VSSIIKLDTGKAVGTPGLAPLRAFAHRRSPRCPLAVPVRVTVLRAGTAYSIPGRSVDLCEGGIAVVLAGEVRPADSVGVEFLLPDLGLGLQAKAVVRHHAPLRCGFEFRGLTRHQQAVIREWVRQRMQAKSEQKASVAGQELEDEESDLPSALGELRQRIAPRWRLLGKVAGALVLAGLLLWWWHWQNGWKELEQQAPQPSTQVISPFPKQVIASKAVSQWSRTSARRA